MSSTLAYFKSAKHMSDSEPFFIGAFEMMSSNSLPARSALLEQVISTNKSIAFLLFMSWNLWRKEMLDDQSMGSSAGSTIGSPGEGSGSNGLGSTGLSGSFGLSGWSGLSGRS